RAGGVRVGIALELHTVTVQVAAQRQLTGKCSSGYAGYLLHRAKCLCKEFVSGTVPGGAVLLEPVTRFLYLHREHVRRIEADVHFEESSDAAKQKSGADQQHDSERDFGDDECLARGLMPAGRALRRLLHSEIELLTRRTQCRYHTNRQTDKCRYHQAEREHGGIESNHTNAWKSRGTERHQRSHAELGDEHAQSTAYDCEQETLGQQLLRQSCSSRTERGTHRELAAPPRAACEQQVGDVGARYQQHEDDGAEYREKDRPHATGHVILERMNQQSALERCPRHTRKVASRCSRDRVELVSCLRQSDAGAHASYHAQMVAPLAAIGPEDRAVLKRCPYLH